MAFQSNGNKGGGNNMQKKVRDNYFKRELQAHRSTAPINFMANKNPVSRDKDCKAICMDLARGNIDIVNEAGYFMQPELITALCNFTYSKMFFYNVLATYTEEEHKRRLTVMGPAYANPAVDEVINTVKRSYIAYEILYRNFNNIKTQGNPEGWLSALVSQLSAGRYGTNI